MGEVESSVSRYGVVRLRSVRGAESHVVREWSDGWRERFSKAQLRWLECKGKYSRGISWTCVVESGEGNGEVEA